MRAIILAAGEGKRLRPLTTYMPKVMLPVGNKPLLQYLIEALRDNKILDITIVVGYQEDKIKQYFGNGRDFGVRIEYVSQKKQLGTAHALSQAKLKEEFLLFYGDNMISTQCVKDLLNTPVNTILGAHSSKPYAYGVIEAKGNRVVKIREKPKEKDNAVVFTGMGHFDGGIFERIERLLKEGVYELPDVLNTMDVKLEVSDCGWKDAIYPWDLLELNSYALQHNVRKLAGKIEECTIIGNVEIGENSRIGAGCYIKGNVKIGDNCEIGPNTVILGDTSIGKGTRIGSLSYIENSIIMEDTLIGEGAYIKDTIVGRKVSIGPKFITLSKRMKRVFEDEILEVNGGPIIGDGANIGSAVVVHGATRIGANSRIGDLKVIDGDVENWESVR